MQSETFPSRVVSIEFLKFVGSEMVGFVGLANGEVWRTTTAGAQWVAMTSASNDMITSFTFKDKDNGWASFMNTTDGDGGVLRTVDGGLNWTVQYTGSPVSAVYYHAPGTRIFMSQWGAASRVSVDDGANWSQLGTNDWNGYSFWDANIGMVSNHVGVHHRTTTGGFAWNAMTPDVDTWRPLAIPNTNMGFIASEESDRIARTYNRGVTWETVPNVTMPLTGHIENSCAMLWVQTENNGLYYSTTHGETWINVLGPNQLPKHSFEITTTTVWAAEESDNSLWRFDLPQTPPPTKLRMTRGPVRINASSCAPVDSAIRIYLSNFCDPFQVTDLTLTGSPDITLKVGQPAQFGLLGRDSIMLTYASPDANRDSANLKITYTVGGTTYDTTILVIGTRGNQLAAQLSYKSMVKDVGPTCTPLDTIFTIKNTPCDPLRIISAKLLDSSIFYIQAPPMPYDLAFDEVATIRIQASSSMQGTYRTKLQVRFLYAGRTIDTLIDLEYKVRNGPLAPNVILPNLILDNPCTVMDTVLRVVNKLCGTLILDSAKVEVGKGVTGANIFPLGAEPTGILRFPIRLQGPAKGKYTARVTLHFTTPFGTYDTTYIISYEVKNDIPRKLGVPASFTFRSTSICAPREEKIYIDNVLCDPVEVTQQQWTLQNPTITIVSQPSYPITLQPGQKDSVVLLFSPTAAGNVTAGIKFDYIVQSRADNATTNIVGVGTASANANVSEPLLVFDSAYSCEGTTEQFTHMVNEGCDSISIVSMRQLAGNEFELVEPTSFPIRLGPGDSVMIRMRPRNKIGTLSDSVEFTYRSLSGGADQAERLALQGYTRPPLRIVELPQTAFVFDSIPPCSTKDTTVWLYSNGICDTLVIDNVSASGIPGITVTSDAPKSLPPGDSIAVRVTMNTGTGGVNGSATITISGPGFDTTITVAMTTSSGDCGGESTLSFSAFDSTFAVEPCGIENSTITVTAQGDQPFRIGRVAIEAVDPGQTQFKFVTPPVVPDELNPGESVSYTVQFDASGVGNQQAFLVIESEDGTFIRRIPLTATINGVTGTMAVALQPVGGASFNRKIGETVSVALFADLDVTPAHDLERIEVDLTYDRDLLSETNFTSPSGWTVSHQETPTGAHLTFTKDMTVPHNRTMPLGEIEYTVCLAENITTTMGITGLTLNSGDPDYVRCRVRPTGTSGSVSVSVDPVCYDSTIRNAMAGRTFASIIAIKPSSVVSTASVSDVRLEYITEFATPVTILVRDQLGRVILEKSAERPMGIHTESLELPGVEGVYFITLQTSGSTETRKLMLQR